MISSEKLKELYIEKRLTTYEIAEIYSVNRSTVSRWLKKYGVKINPTQRKYELVKKIPLTSNQRELVFGTLLGDGCIAPHGRKNISYRLMVGHCEKQKELVFWKKEVLGNFVNVVNRRVDKRGNSIMYNFSTVTHNDFRYFHKLFYENNKKVIREEMINHLSPFALSVWVMDDGSRYRKKNTMRISTDGFSKQENELLKYFIKTNFNINSKVCEYNRNDNKFYYLSFNVRNSALLSDVIRPYVIDCVQYKLCPSRSSTTKRQTSKHSPIPKNEDWRAEWDILKKNIHNRR